MILGNTALSEHTAFNVLDLSALSSRKTVVHGGSIIPHPFAISLFESTIYYTDWTKMAVMKANKFSDSSPQVVYNTAQTPHGVAVIHRYRQPNGEPGNRHQSSFIDIT